MGFMALVFIAGGSAFTLIYLLTYAPLFAMFFGKIWSPRLALCKLLGPMDIGFTLILIIGSWTGLSTAATGISMLVYNVLTGIGLSIGVVIAKWLFIPRWQRQFDEMKLQRGKANVQSTVGGYPSCSRIQ